MSTVTYPSDSYISFVEDGVLLFKIMADGTIERGPGFTTVDEMSTKFWDAVEKNRRPIATTTAGGVSNVPVR